MEQARILIVDDEPFNLDVLEQELELLGHASMRAANGEEALERLEVEPFDLALLDVMMPRLDGYGVLERMKSHEAWRHIPVIMISALTDMRSVVRCIACGADDYLPKPFEPVLLKARIGACLERKRLHDREAAHLARSTSSGGAPRNFCTRSRRARANCRSCSSTRPQPARCSMSSVVLQPPYSRCSTRSSKAPRVCAELC